VVATWLAAHDGAVRDGGESRRAVVAAISTASALGLEVEDAVVLSDSNRFVIRLTPCDIVARVSPRTHFASAEREVELVKRLARTDSPVATLEAGVEPRVFVRDGFKVAMWTYFEPLQPRALPPAEYARALEHLHAGLRQIDVTTSHVMDRVAAVQQDVANLDVTPDLADADRALLADTLRDLRRSIAERRAPEQLLHGEPHPWNVLDTNDGLLFIDFENTSQGPVEYDLAWVPDEVAERYQNADQDLVGACRGLVLAIIAMHRWRRDDHHPSGRRSGVAFLDALRDGPPWPALDDVAW
jgi:Phosphotransferase enzyme family